MFEVNFIYSLIFYQSSAVPQMLVFLFIFFYIVAIKSALICAKIYLLPTVNCETRSVFKAAVNRVLLLSWDAITPVMSMRNSPCHNMWKYAR